MQLKQCAKCKKNKVISEFYVNRARKDGITTECGDCISIRAAQWRMDNPERVEFRYKHYYKTHKSRAQKYYLANAERLKKYQREYSRKKKKNREE